MSPVERAAAFDRKIQRRNRLEWLAAAVVSGYFGFVASAGRTLPIRLSALAIVGAAAFVAWYIHRNGRVRLPPLDDLPAADAARAYSTELVRHARHLRTSPLWYVTPLTLAASAFVVATAEPHGLLSAAIVLLPLFVTTPVLAWLNLRAAQQLEAEAAAVVAE